MANSGLKGKRATRSNRQVIARVILQNKSTAVKAGYGATDGIRKKRRMKTKHECRCLWGFRAAAKQNTETVIIKKRLSESEVIRGDLCLINTVSLCSPSVAVIIF